MARSRDSPTCSRRRARRREARPHRRPRLGRRAGPARRPRRGSGAPAVGQPGRCPQAGRHRVAGGRVHQTGCGPGGGHGLRLQGAARPWGCRRAPRPAPRSASPPTVEAGGQPPPQLVAGHRGRRGEAPSPLPGTDPGRGRARRGRSAADRAVSATSGLAGDQSISVHDPAGTGGRSKRARRPNAVWWARAGPARRSNPPAAARGVDDQPDGERVVVGVDAVGCPSRSAARPRPCRPRIGLQPARTRREDLVQAGVVDDRVRARHGVLVMADDADRRPRGADDGRPPDRFELVHPAAVRRRPDRGGRGGHQHGLDAGLRQRSSGSPSGRPGPDDRDVRVEPRGRGRHLPSSAAMCRNRSTTFGAGGWGRASGRRSRR